MKKFRLGAIALLGVTASGIATQLIGENSMAGVLYNGNPTVGQLFRQLCLLCEFIRTASQMFPSS